MIHRISRAVNRFRKTDMLPRGASHPIADPRKTPETNNPAEKQSLPGSPNPKLANTAANEMMAIGLVSGRIA